MRISLEILLLVRPARLRFAQSADVPPENKTAVSAALYSIRQYTKSVSALDLQYGQEFIRFSSMVLVASHGLSG